MYSLYLLLGNYYTSIRISHHHHYHVDNCGNFVAAT